MAVVLTTSCHLATAHPDGEKTVFSSAQDYIEAFRQGKRDYDFMSLPGLMIGNQPDPQAMKALGEELTTGTEDVREKIVDLLIAVGRLNHLEYELRTPEVIDLLIGAGFSKADTARSNAMDALFEYAAPAVLAGYGDAITKALEEKPGESALKLVAKAKPPQAWKEVDRLSRLPEWSLPNTSTKATMLMTRAALGDTETEDKFIDWAAREEAAGNADGLVDALFMLARIGTPRSLQAVCERMRTPLIVDRGSHQKSVRLDVMNALRHAFPGHLELDPSNVTEDADYERAEWFCIQTIGVRFGNVPRPEFFTSKNILLE